VEVADAAAAASRAADEVVAVVREAVAAGGVAHLALSGGSTPWAMLGELAGRDLPWAAVHVWQVDERVAPDGDPARNLSHLAPLVPAVATLHPMLVADRSPEAAAQAYAAELPEHLDLVHLGLGPDGHTASLVPGDPVLGVVDAPVAATAGPYQGHRRVTLTYPGLRRARRVLWLVVGADKAAALARLRDADPAIPAGRVAQAGAVVVADRAALSG
jgi:6-phosphogluconolactonase